MKNRSLSVLLLAVFFTAFVSVVSAQNTVTAKRIERLDPPKTFKLDRIEASATGVRYDISFKNNSTGAFFATDIAGKLVNFHVVVDDHNAGSFRLVRGEWISDTTAASFDSPTQEMGFDCAVWTKFFSEKVSPPVPVTVRDEGSGSIIMEKGDGNASSTGDYEVVGYAFDAAGKRQLALKSVGAVAQLRMIFESDFAVVPQDGQKFRLGQLNGTGKYYPISFVTTVNKELLTVVVVP